MFAKEFYEFRQKVYDFLSAELPDGDFEPMVVGSSYVNVPFDVDGTPLEISKRVPFEPIDAPYDAFDNDFMLSHGYVAPITTFRGNVQNVLSGLNPDFVKNMLNPAPVEPKSE